jgi:L-amino acid N-acyltransferase YncA
VEIRNAVSSDVEHITDIYNDVLRTSTAIFNDQPTTVDERRAYWAERTRRGYPMLVAADEGRVLGYATFGDFRAGPGYRHTVEGTIHVHASERGKGIGKLLLTELLGRARAAGKHVMIAGVDASNEVSLQFLQGFGFVQTGHLREVGYKFERYLDLVFLQRML